jgi:hypothetical protein
VQQRPTLRIPRDEVGTARELVVLIRLVKARRNPQLAKSSRFALAHGRVDEINIKVAWLLSTRVDERYVRSPAECVGHPSGALCGSGPTRLDEIQEGRRYPGSVGELRHTPTSALARVAYLLPEQHPQPIDCRRDLIRGLSELFLG